MFSSCRCSIRGLAGSCVVGSIRVEVGVSVVQVDGRFRSKWEGFLYGDGGDAGSDKGVYGFDKVEKYWVFGGGRFEGLDRGADGGEVEEVCGRG